MSLFWLAAGCGRADPQGSAPDHPARVASAAAEVERTRARQDARPGTLSVDDLIVLGYMERLRLGLGSPFALMEEVLDDTLLPEPHRSNATLALLDATARGHAYALDPAALTLLGRDRAGRPREAAALHADLIETAMLGAEDPDVSAEVVRLAYRRAAAERLVDPAALDVVELAVAMVRARELARADAVQLRERAAAAGAPPEELVAPSRSGKRLRVEEPPRALGDTARAEAERQAQLLVRAIRRITHPRREPWPAVTDYVERSYLSRHSARRLAAVVDGMQLPPEPRVWKTLERQAPRLRGAACDTVTACRAVERLLERADTEQAFAAEYAAVAERAGPAAPLLARAALEVSAALGPGGVPPRPSAGKGRAAEPGRR